MAQSNGGGNKGVIVSGGKLSADNLAVGDHASITNHGNSQGHDETALKLLIGEISVLIDAMKKDQVDSEKIEAAALAKSELESNSPNFFVAKSILLSVVDGLKAIGSASGSVLAIKKLLETLLP